ncbi:Carboxypeptidase A1 precursor [hydrothermal vent metagenome]|uniref:Carboxypeptidase A1 n=1 Tax=hydrothermal vent metagenome TaxID=652676 RepID=A0A1W1D416_9ZZZZ
MRQQYSSYEECVSFFQQAQKEYPNLFFVESIGKTHEERDIIAVSITNNVQEHHKKPALFYTGTIHAREWIGVELSLAFAKYIIEQAKYNPELNAILDKTTLYMVPCANPDGFEYSRNHFAFWRKNRRRNKDGSFGVDLNRNFEVGFSKNSNMTSNVYSGPHPFSEPETRALRDFVLGHKNITIALDYHSQGNVFFPAHNFIHEDAIDAIDLNLLASNMAEEIRKESGREYGVHMGKPPTKLISGSGREFYYSQGILSLVVEVGTRNISDYQENMSENIAENIPALIYALSEVNNYQKDNLPRVEAFQPLLITSREVELSWEYDDNDFIYFEIYRSTKSKGYAQVSNRIGVTKSKTFLDKNLQPATNYYYFIRAIDKKSGLKSPFAQKIGLRTNPASDMFSKILYPVPSKIGYVGEKTKKNSEHFGYNSMFVGISEGRGECFGVCGFSLQTIPQHAIITSAKISFYPMNRVAVQVESYGEWRVGQMDGKSIKQIDDFQSIKDAKMLSYIDRPTGSAQLSQGIWRTYQFARQELDVLQEALKQREAYFRMEGPSSLPLNRASQMMQWDIGYGPFSGGLTFRPKLDISYTLEDAKVELLSSEEYTVTKEDVIDAKLSVGYDRNGEKQFGYMEFDLSHLPHKEDTTISVAYIDIEVHKIASLKNIRFHIEMVLPFKEKNYENIKAREVIERIGYDVSVSELKNSTVHRFVFDSYAIKEILKCASTLSKAVFVISASSEIPFTKSQVVEFIDEKRLKRPSLVMQYIKKHQVPPKPVKNLRYSISKGMIKLEWDKSDDISHKGVIVVKNPFKIPSTPYDGQKLYGGGDNYTFDNFGSKDVHKYYAVFSYDDVPNFSKPAVLEYNGRS